MIDEMKCGRACAVFECEAEKDEIEREFSIIRSAIGTSNTVKAVLHEVKKRAEDANGRRLYAVELTSPNETNKQASDELAAILNQAFHSPLWGR